MSRFNTGNPIGSADPRDRDDNTKNLDELVNSKTKTNVPDRLGVPRKTWHSMESEFSAEQSARASEFNADQSVRALEFDSDQLAREQQYQQVILGYGNEPLGDYAAGIEVTGYNQIIRDCAGGTCVFYRAAAGTELPYTTTGLGMPEGGAFVDVGDAVLRQDLADPDKGAAMVGFKQSGAGAVYRTLADKARETVSVRDFGAAGDGSDSTQAFLGAASYLEAQGGGGLFVPPGEYRISSTVSFPSRTKLFGAGAASKIISDIPTPNLEPTNLFEFKGEIAGEKPISAPATRGDTTVSVDNSDGLLRNGDLCVIVSQRSALSEDAGTWRLGSGPGEDAVYFAEFFYAKDVSSGNVTLTNKTLVFPDYFPDNSQETDVTARDSATLVKVSPASGCSVSDLYFESVAQDNVILYPELTQGFKVSNCDFYFNGNRGAACLSTNTFKTTFKNSSIEWSYESDYEPYYRFNPVKLRGCSGFVAENVVSENAAQTFDATYLEGGWTTTFATMRNCNIINSQHNVATSHPGCYGVDFLNNRGTGVFGFQVRSPFTTISGNTIELNGINDDSAGVFIADGQLFGVKISNNFFRGGARGVTINQRVPSAHAATHASETRQYDISGNVFELHRKDAILVSLTDLGVRETTLPSGLSITGNVFRNIGTPGEITTYAVYIRNFVNNPNISNNTFFNINSDYHSAIRVSDNCISPTIKNNGFSGTSPSNLVSYRTPVSDIFDGVFDRVCIVGNYNSSQDGQISSTYSEYGRFAEEQAIVGAVQKDWSYDRVRKFLAVEGGRPTIYLTSDGTVATRDPSIVFSREDAEGLYSLTYRDSNANFRFLRDGAIDLFITPTAFSPGSDNTKSSANPVQRWSEVYAATGTINTSDSREKQQVLSISDAEGDAALELKGMIRKFKWNHAVERKGAEARWHFGVMAQEVAEVFDRHGLDAHDYGLFCYDEWDEQPEEIDEDTGEVVEEYRPAGDRYGVRYDQLLAFIISAM